jgi:hypothetical protein
MQQQAGDALTTTSGPKLCVSQSCVWDDYSSAGGVGPGTTLVCCLARFLPLRSQLSIQPLFPTRNQSDGRGRGFDSRETMMKDGHLLQEVEALGCPCRKPDRTWLHIVQWVRRPSSCVNATTRIQGPKNLKCSVWISTLGQEKVATGSVDVRGNSQGEELRGDKRSSRQDQGFLVLLGKILARKVPGLQARTPRPVDDDD